jgi:hypothetical protein
VIYEDNFVTDNTDAGIMHEISFASVIRGNFLRGNCHDLLLGGVNGFCGNIFISSSENVEIYNNTVEIDPAAGSFAGITLWQGDRVHSFNATRRFPPVPPFAKALLRNNSVHNNEIRFVSCPAPHQTARNGLVNFFNSSAYFAQSNNTWTRNSYETLSKTGGAEPHWWWCTAKSDACLGYSFHGFQQIGQDLESNQINGSSECLISLRATKRVLSESPEDQPRGSGLVTNSTMKTDDEGPGPAVCDPAGVKQTPPVCQQQQLATPRGGEHALGETAFLPNIFGGPATRGNCVYGHFGAGGYGGVSCWTGSLFGFSGVDGPTSVASEFFGWFVNGSYSLYLWGPNRHLRLGFGPDAGADQAVDDVLVATNDALLVKTKQSTSSSQLGLTWRDWRTIVGFVEGPDAHVRLEELTGHGEPPGGACAVPAGCCGAVKQFSFKPAAAAAPVSFQYWRWVIEKTHDASGSTICFIGFDIGGSWKTDPSWNVSAAFHSFEGGAPAGVLSRDCGSFWNAAASPHGPWNLTIDARKPIAPTGFEYSIYVPTEAPSQFKILGASAATGPWNEVFRTANAPTGGCEPRPPPPPPPPYWADPAIRGVNATSDPSGDWTLAFATHPSGRVAGRTDFALCFNEKRDQMNHSTAPGAMACANLAAAAGETEQEMAKRNAYILSLPPLKDPADDRFQRKLLSVMKVNSMSPEGDVAYNWSTSCRAPHKCKLEMISYSLMYIAACSCFH